MANTFDREYNEFNVNEFQVGRDGQTNQLNAEQEPANAPYVVSYWKWSDDRTYWSPVEQYQADHVTIDTAPSLRFEFNWPAERHQARKLKDALWAAYKRGTTDNKKEIRRVLGL